MTPEPLCGEHKRGCDPEHKRVCDPFSLATTSVARASAVGLEKLETLEALEELEKLEELVRLEPLEKQARNEKNVAHLRKKAAYSWRFKRKDVYLQR